VVEVRSRIVGDNYLVEVEDNGVGIPVEERPRIFDKFYRGRHGEAASGAGLGLPISREIVGRMRGSLSLVSSTREGTCFRVTLPLTDASIESGRTNAI
jgi:signal transduction histidine kinase